MNKTIYLGFISIYLGPNLSQIVFWLLDINYEMVRDIPEIRLWGIDENNRRIVVLDRSFRPYFYVVPENEKYLESLPKEIEKRFPKDILHTEISSKDFFGKSISVIRIVCRNPKKIPSLRDDIAKIIGVKNVLEADISFYLRYMIDNDIYPSSWHVVEAEEVKEKRAWQVDAIYLAKNPPKNISEKREIPKLKFLAFDIECYNQYGTPRPERDPVIIICTKTSEGEEKIFLAKDRNDRDVMEEFSKYVLEYNPDIIVGYNSNLFDWPYLVDRCKKYKYRLKISRTYFQPMPSLYGHISIVGRANVDLYDYAKDLPEVKVRTLENVAEYLGVMKKSERVLIPGEEIYKYWDNPKLREKLIEYCLDDVRSIYLLAKEILPFAIQLSSIVGLPLDIVGTASVGYRVEWHLIRQAYKFNELIPNKVERPYRPYRGAIVLKPLPGLHEDIAVLDFSSMYPNIMINYNISPDTYVPLGEKVSEVNIAPEVGHKFRKKPDGFYRKVLKRLLAARKEIKDKLKKLDPKSNEYKILYERQRAVKIIANATYGYCGWVGARWYKREVAEATTAWGRKIITETIRLAKSMGLKLIYGDTDSIFVRYDKDKVEKFIDTINSKLGLEIKIDKIYRRVFFTEAKKRYCGLLYDGRIDVVGLEAVRGDWSELAKEVQENVIKIILTENSPSKAAGYVQDVIRNLKNQKIPLSKLIIWKTVTKNIDEYEVAAAHVVAAKKLLASGYPLTVGDKVGYIVVKRPGVKLADKVEPYIFVKNYSDIDIEYYINKQIVPVATRILGFFGYSEKQLLAGTRQASLSDFF